MTVNFSDKIDAAPASRQLAVRVAGINHYFGLGDARSQVLFDNNIDIDKGQLIIMTGPSGSGKTTLLTLIGALRTVQEGQIELLGHPLHRLTSADLITVRQSIGFIFQMHNLFESLTARENVMMALDLAEVPHDAMKDRARDMLEKLGLGHRVDHYPDALSGGQRQRVAVARALVNRPKIVLADEPTAALDKESSRTVVNLLKDLAREEGSTILMVTHDNRILDAADRIVRMVDGRIASNVSVVDTMQICEFLKNVEIFARLAPTELTNVAEKMIRRDYSPGSIVIRQGDPGEEFFVIGGGRVLVSQNVNGADKTIAELTRGHIFGEAALLSDLPRNATVKCLDDVTVHVLGKKDFKAAIDSSETFREQLLKVFFQRQ